jgi:S1-C subfamily serine protease
MPIQFQCPVCLANYSVDDKEIGKKAWCKSCGQRLEVPVPPRLRTVVGAVQPTLPPQRSTDILGTPVVATQPPTSSPQRSAETLGTPVITTPPPTLPPIYPSRRSDPSRNALVVFGLIISGILLVSLVVIAIVMAGRFSTTEPTRPPVADRHADPVTTITIQTAPKKSAPSVSSPPTRRPQDGDQVYRRIAGSAVLIACKDATGSGIVVSRDRRLILTNYHVVPLDLPFSVIFPKYSDSGEIIADASEYTISHENAEGRGKVVARDSKRDLALIRVDRIPSSAKAISIADYPAATGSTVYVVGGSGTRDNLLWRLTKGTVRGRTHRQTIVEIGVIDCMVLETDAAINRGDSGALVANDQGELVGVVSYTDTSQRQVAGNIDVTEVKKFLDEHLPSR